MVGGQLKHKLLLLLASLIVSLVACEVIIRIAIPYVRGTHQHPSSIWRDDFIREDRIGQYDPKLGWVLQADSRTTHRSWEFEYTLSTNSRGLRDDETPYERTAGLDRLVLLGDSFAMGYGVERAHSLEKRLEQLLDAEVVNLAVPGYGTDQALLAYESEGRKYHPDVVLLAFTIDNDVLNNGTSNQYDKNKPYFALRDGELVLEGVPVPPEPFPSTNSESPTEAGSPFPIHDFLDASSAVYALIFDRLAQIETLRRHWEESGLLFAQIDLFYPSQVGMLRRQVGAESPVWQLTLALIDRLRQTCIREGSIPVLVLIPSQLQVYEESLDRVIAERRLNPADLRFDHPNRILTEYARACTLEVIDLLPPLQAAAAQGEMPYFKRNPHWSRVGHHRAASAIADRLAEISEAVR